MTVVCPGDPVEVKLATRDALNQNGPVYIRLGKKGEAVIHKQEPAFKIGKALTVRDGSKICLLSTGNTLPLALEAAEKLEQKGVTPRVVSFHTVKPLDIEFLTKTFSDFSGEFSLVCWLHYSSSIYL
jgi:transketolase